MVPVKKILALLIAVFLVTAATVGCSDDKKTTGSTGPKASSTK
jgi:hypothetical protein